jgi:glycine cleavage system H protein
MAEAGLKFTKSHEWIRVEGDDAVVGLTDYAQGELGDIVFIELPDKGKSVSSGDVLTTVESVKSVSEIFAPLSGEVVDANSALDDDPSLINSDPYGQGWIVKIRLSDKGELDATITGDEYEELTKG